MGKDKARLAVGGEFLWERQLRLLRELRPQVVAVSARSRPGWCPADVVVILDERPSRGPLSGLAKGLAGLRTTHLLALAVDMPRMTVVRLRALLARARLGRGVMPVRDGRLEGLCAIYPAEAAGLARARLKGGDVSLRAFAEELAEQGMMECVEVGRREAVAYSNINTPEEFEEALRKTR